MTKFKYKDNSISISCEGYTLSEVRELLSISRGDARETLCDISLNNSSDKVIPQIKKDNDIEEVNLSDITRDIRMPKTTNNFRCPSCHQGVLINVSSNSGTIHVIRDVRSEKPSLHLLNIEGYGDEFVGIDPCALTKNKNEIIKVYKELLNIMEDPLFFTDDTLSKATCPICGETHYLNEWIEAYEKPMNFNADSHNLCDICGDSGQIEITRDGDSLVCEHKCIQKIIV